jgi:general L-amino acid transport system substrate-binding protein
MRAVAFALLWLVCIQPASAGAVIDRIKATNTIHCGAAPRSGLAGVSGGAASGLYLDLCRAVGAALLGPQGRLEFHLYGSDKAFDNARAGTDDLMFLSGGEILGQDLAGKVALGPPVYFVAMGAMVPDASPAKTLADLAGRTLCFYQGANSHRALEAWMAAHRLDFTPMGYTEWGELYDGYNSHVCEAQVGEIQDLAVERLDEADAPLKSRILTEPLGEFPIFAATPANDAEWSEVVALAIQTLERAEIPASPWKARGLDSFRVRAPELGLSAGWRERVVGAAGSYSDIYARNLGDRTQLRLPRGHNAPTELGGWFVTAYDD